MKKLSAFLLSFLLCVGMCACGKESGETSIASDVSEISEISVAGSEAESSEDAVSVSVTSEKEVYEVPEEMDFEAKVNGNYIIACDQMKDRVVVYDMSKYDGIDLDNCAVWSYTPKSSSRVCISGVKYRENTVYGDVVLICSSEGYAGVVTYPEGEEVWSVSYCGQNPHSIEILPTGDIVCASSNDKHIRLYRCGDNKNYVDYELDSAHGVLWDPDKQLLWALGYSRLVSYKYEDGALTVKKEYPLPVSGGHALSADFSDPDKLMVTTGTAVYSFSKQKRRFTRIIQFSDSIKGYGNDPCGDTFYCFPNKGIGRKWEKKYFAEWCTDTIYFKAAGEDEFTEAKSSTCAFYKVYNFYGKYQPDRK